MSFNILLELNLKLYYMSFTARGVHSMLDYNNCIIPQKNTEAVLLNIMFNLKNICQNNELRIVGEKMVIFDGSVSPSGGTAIVLLDESHISLHCYGEEGLCAWDLFTCSKKPENHMNALDDIKELMAELFPDGELTKPYKTERFLTPFRQSSPNPVSES